MYLTLIYILNYQSTYQNINKSLLLSMAMECQPQNLGEMEGGSHPEGSHNRFWTLQKTQWYVYQRLSFGKNYADYPCINSSNSLCNEYRGFVYVHKCIYQISDYNFLSITEPHLTVHVSCLNQLVFSHKLIVIMFSLSSQALEVSIMDLFILQYYIMTGFRCLYIKQIKTSEQKEHRS